MREPACTASDTGHAWTSQGVSAYLSSEPDDTTPVFDGPGLSIHAVSPHHMIALKARRGWPQDLADLRVLTRAAGFTGSADVLATVDRFFPDDPISPRARAAVEDAFGAPPS